ncbi:hypothetical protein ACIBHX_32960 [Nonomuraea sp. NPDC050536]|uniref:hypothetical protein n=1 Tax=Nonomuraea sp. NPDC050536 TaxID=3364366 RepID=UPI0037CA72DF
MPAYRIAVTASNSHRLAGSAGRGPSAEVRQAAGSGGPPYKITPKIGPEAEVRRAAGGGGPPYKITLKTGPEALPY